jgi:hypothetical protein
MPTFDFDVSGYEAAPARSFDPLPRGEYAAIITESQLKQTKAGNGEYIELSIQIIDGEHSGRKLWERLNVHNENKQAEDISRRTLKQIGEACGVEHLRDTESLHDIPMTILVDIDRRDAERNKIVAYSAGAPASRPVLRPAASAPVLSAKKAWEK